MMGDFFRGWRRKIGVATLVLACGLTCLWMVTTNCSFHFATSYVDPVQFVTAKDGYLRWATYTGFTTSQPIDFRVGLPHRVELDIIESQGFQKDLVWQWHSAWGGFEFGNGLSRSVRIWAAPFWAIILPLILISALLLLTGHRKSNPKERIEAIPKEASPTNPQIGDERD